MLKTLKRLAVALLILAPAMMNAQNTVTVAEGTASSNSVPFRPFNAPYAQWTQSIYPASQLTALQGHTLSAFTYHTSVSTFTPAPGQWTISLAVTTRSDLAYGKDQTTTTQVFSGTPTFDIESQNMTFTFDTPFEYTGGNLLVYFDHQAGTTSAQDSWTFQSLVLTDASRYAYNSSYSSSYNGEGSLAAYLPTIIVSIDGEGGGAQGDTCQTVVVDAAHPFTETFLDTWQNDKPTACWAANEHVAGSGVTRWSKSYQGHDDLYGAKMAYTYSYGGAINKANLVSPRLDIPQAEAYTVGLWLKRITNSAVRTEAGVRVFVNSTPDTVGATLLFFAPQHIAVEPAVSEDGWYYFEGIIPNAGEQYVIIQGVDQGMSDIWIDEFSVQAVPNCSNPTDMTWNAEELAVEWEAGTATQWQVREGEECEVVNTNSYSNTAWLPATTHNVYVRSICGAGDTLGWRGPVSFTMPCEAIVLDGTTTFSEDFETLTTSGATPTCWATSHVSGPGTQLWGSYSGTGHSGSRMMRLPDMSATTVTYLVSPEFDIAQADRYQVNLWVKRDGSGSSKPNEGVKVWANSTPDTVGGTMLFHAHRYQGIAPVVTSTGWYEFNGIIPLSGTVYIVIEGISEYGNATHIDDFSVTLAPLCSHPEGFAFDDDSIRVVWTAGTATQWQVREGDSLTMVDAPEYRNPAWESNTGYSISVRSICGEGDTNEWQPVFAFVTPRMFFDTVQVHDTVYVPQVDTVYVPQVDTVYVPQVDTVYVPQVDTVYVPQVDTIYITHTDTVIIHDTIYVHDNAIDGADGIAAKIYTARGQIVVDGARAGEAVRVYDISGRLLTSATVGPDRYSYPVPTSGIYMVRIGDRPAYKLVVKR